MQKKHGFLSLLRLKKEERQTIVGKGYTRRQKYAFHHFLYISFVIGVIFLICAILIAEVGDKIGPFNFEKKVEKLAFFLSSHSFMDLSGMASENANETETEAFSKETVPTMDIPSGSIDRNPSLDSQSSLYTYDLSLVPADEKPIIPMDLSLIEYGSEYFFNQTDLSPNVSDLLQNELNFERSYEWLTANYNQPQVLIFHTHGTEAYSENGALSFRDMGEELARSEKNTENVVAVGSVLAQTLNNAGIPTVHCMILHDQMQYKDSYARAEETIKDYLKRYPSIRLVIDLHRDAILKSDGALVRPVTMVNGEIAAQVMCVVGSGFGKDNCPQWEQNFSIALQLRKKLNDSHGNLCRPISLRGSTYNQELAPASLLLEIGAAGNSLEEATVSARLVGLALAELIKK